jgi:hypothetical protein
MLSRLMFLLKDESLARLLHAQASRADIFEAVRAVEDRFVASGANASLDGRIGEPR